MVVDPPTDRLDVRSGSSSAWVRLLPIAERRRTEPAPTGGCETANVVNPAQAFAFVPLLLANAGSTEAALCCHDVQAERSGDWCRQITRKEELWDLCELPDWYLS
jgi:hypothetical protein